jgi:hypothetical protein
VCESPRQTCVSLLDRVSSRQSRISRTSILGQVASIQCSRFNTTLQLVSAFYDRTKHCSVTTGRSGLQEQGQRRRIRRGRRTFTSCVVCGETEPAAVLRRSVPQDLPRTTGRTEQRDAAAKLSRHGRGMRLLKIEETPTRNVRTVLS